MKKGFTLIETLVAVAILMVAIAGPLNIAEKGLTAADNSKDQTIASFLAEDLVEYVENIRDGNVLNSATWTNSLCDSTGSQTLYCTAETATGDYVTPSIFQTNLCAATILVGGVGGCQLYVTSTGYYTYSPTNNMPTPFYRTFTLTPIPNISQADDNNVRLLTVRVYWMNGTIPNTFVMQTLLYNTPR